MGCIQSYFRKAAEGSSQASPSDIIKHIIEHEHHSKTTSESSKLPAVSLSDTSPICDEAEMDLDSENAEQRSLHCVEATAVRQLAASTGTVAILGTTAKYNETIDYRQSIHSEQGLIFQYRDIMAIDQKEEQELSERQLKQQTDVTTTFSDTTESANIITTAIIEAPPTRAETAKPIGTPVSKISTKPQSNPTSPCEDHPNVVEVSSTPLVDLQGVVERIETKIEQIQPTTLHVEKAETSTKEFSEDASEDNKTNENSERDSSSSEVISVVKESIEGDINKRHSRSSFEVSRPNRLSLGQQSIESDQNTIEISSADDVKNESTDITSPESLNDSLIKSLGSRSKFQDSESFREEMARTISNTSLNTLGNDSDDDASNMDADVCKKSELVMKRFDTISSNGESSHKMEEPNYPSATELPELEDYIIQPKFSLEPTVEEVFDNKRLEYEASVRQSVTSEVDKICEQAVEKTTDILLTKAEGIKYGDDIDYSLFSTMDSVIAEKGSDFDSLSLLDERSDSRSVSMLDEDTKSKTEMQINAIDDTQKHLQEADRSLTFAEVDAVKCSKNAPVSSQDTPGSVIQKDRSLNSRTTLTRSISDDLPKPPNVEDLPPLPENFDQYDITEEELKAVQLPENTTRIRGDISIEEAISKIQAGVRGYLIRKQIKILKNEQIVNDSNINSKRLKSFDVEYYKSFKKNKRLSLDSKLVDIENIQKLANLKNPIAERIEEEDERHISDLNKAASKIQNSYRNYKERKSICMGDTNPEKTVLSGTTNDVQSKFKGIVTSKSKVLYNDEAQPMIEGNEEIEDNSKFKSEDPVKQAAVKIQATYRGFRARKSLQISSSAATKIQAHFRGYQVRKNFIRCSSLNDIGPNSNSFSCSNLSNQLAMEKHATKIQAGIRGYLVRKRHSLQNNAAAKIQMNYRKYKSKKT